MVDYIKRYKQFTSSYYLTEGLRITSGVMIPILILSYYDQISIAMAVGLGSLFVSLSDNPGPLHHRQNGMTVSMILIFMIAIIIGFSVAVPWLLALELLLFSFVFSMIGIYGVRASSIGLVTLFVMVLNIDDSYTAKETLINATSMLLGGCWYFFWSLLLHRVRPYRLAQQATGDCIIAVANYLRIKASLYDEQVDYEKTYKALFDQQAQVHSKQDLVREILYKTRSIVKDSTYTGRILVITFIDSIDIFESIMTSQRDYKAMHKVFPSDVLHKFQNILLLLADELDVIGLAVQEGDKSFSPKSLEDSIQSLESFLTDFSKQQINDQNIDDLIGLQHILDSIKDIYNRIDTLHRYTTYDKEQTSQLKLNTDYSQFVSATEINPKLLIDNLNIHSNIFRHSVRVAVAIFIGYIISNFLPFGQHNYWIMLTVLVILKPAYSLTRQRNFQRLTGTFIGAVIGVIALYFIKDKTVLLAILIISMVAAFSFMRIQYLISTVFVTNYLVIGLYLLKPVNLSTVAMDRFVDTFIGSVLAYIMIQLIPPKWEHEQIKKLLQDVIKANAAYFQTIASAFTGKGSFAPQYKLLRKQVYVTLANLSDTFQRMQSEPRSKQKNTITIYELLVANHLLSSHTATLSSYTTKFAQQYYSEDFTEIIEKTDAHLLNAASLLDESTADKIDIKDDAADGKFVIGERLQLLTQKKLAELGKNNSTGDNESDVSAIKTITDQFGYIYRIGVNVEKMAVKML